MDSSDYAARHQQRFQQFQQQQMLHEQNEYAAYFGVPQQSPPIQSPILYSPQPHYSQNQSPQAFLPYQTSSAFDNALVDTSYMQDDYARHMMLRERRQDPWNELAEWYWNLYNDHEGLLDPSETQERGRHESYDSSNSPEIQNIATIEEKPDLPEKPFRDQLVHLYFVHVHPITPVIDEHEFCEAYDASEDGLSVLQHAVTLLEFQAMLFAGALHLNSTQLGHTKYAGTHECHRALFKAAKNTYHAHQHENRIAATRAAILLSLWAPYNSDHSNSYWVDQALANAQAASLDDPDHQESTIPVGRRKLIWMSCLRRDRYLAFASRRSTRLSPQQQNTSMTITREHYGLEAVKPRFMSLVAKWASIENFTQQLELSQIMLRLLKFQKSRGFGRGEKREWAEGVDMAQLLEATGIHAQMQAWRRGVEWGFLEGRVVGIGSCDGVVRLTSIQYESAIAFLYLPYIYVRPGVKTAITKEFSDLALQEVKKACSNIARSSEVFVDAANSNDIPLSLGAWILLPIVMKLVFLWHNPTPASTPAPDVTPSYPISPADGRGGGFATVSNSAPQPPHQRTDSTCSQNRPTLTFQHQSTSPSFSHAPTNPATDLHEMRTLMTLLYIIKNRYSGGEYVSTLLDTVMTKLQEERGKRGEEALSLLQDAAEVIDRALASRVLVGGSGGV